ncbi:MAG: metallophosphoesterase family protein [Oscillospiraceae bacterium]|nr:metallophosphoesterase family protein [Oscillospiraceae bacterium]
MRFKKDKPFVIMQIADAQDGPNISPDTLKLISAALDKVKPDLVVLTGDQIKGYDAAFRAKGAEATPGRIRKALHDMLHPVVERGIPFAPTFGNHDSQGFSSPTGKNAQMGFYKELPGCLAPTAESDDVGTYTIPIQASDSSQTALNVYMIDSNGNAGTGYEPVKPEQIEWYRAQRNDLTAANGGKVVPSIVFQHIPVQEYYEVLTKVEKNAPGTIRAYRKFAGYWKPNPEYVYSLDYMGESIACPDENTGEFAAMLEKGDVFAMYVGHDHKNSWAAHHPAGMDLGYCPGSGFNTYGPSIDRAVRVFEIPEENPRGYKTYTLRYRDIVGKKVTHPIMNFINSNTPTNADDGLRWGLKILGALAGLSVLIWLLAHFL